METAKLEMVMVLVEAKSSTIDQFVDSQLVETSTTVLLTTGATEEEDEVELLIEDADEVEDKLLLLTLIEETETDDTTLETLDITDELLVITE